jgi:lysyl-tRNA synthetase class 2
MLFPNSSVLRSVDYDPEARTLDVTFTNGKNYTYFGVPDWKYDELITAKSAGQYFNENIRDQYAFEER